MRGDVQAATASYDQLAQGAKTAAEKAEIYIRVGRLLEDKGDRDGAIERYKLALDADASATVAATRLRDLYASRGDAAGAVEMLQREIEAAEGSLARAQLFVQLARLYRDRIKDRDKARDAAQKAALLDQANEEASTLFGDILFDDGEWADAAKALAPRYARAKDLEDKGEGLRLALRMGEALVKAGEQDLFRRCLDRGA